jgi:hypothetical protein
VDDDEPYARRLPGRVVAAAYLLAGLGFLIPLAAIGSVWAGVVLLRQGRPGDGAAVLVLTVVAVGAGIVVLR